MAVSWTKARPDRQEEPRSPESRGMKRFQFTLGQFSVFVVLVAIVLAIPAPALGTIVTLIVLAAPAVLISQLPYRIRLAVEIVILLALMILAAIVWQSHFYANQADEAAQFAVTASDWAAESKSFKEWDILHREAAWFSRRAVTLRARAVWEGFLHGPTYPSGGLSREEHRRLLDMMWELKRHKDAARAAHESSVAGRRGPRSASR